MSTERRDPSRGNSWGGGYERPSFEILGTAAKNAEVQRSAERFKERYRKVADELVERLLIDGTGEKITLDDIEKLSALSESAQFRRKIIVELMVCLREK